MAASPVTPADFAAVVPTATDTPCQKYEKLQQFAGLVNQYIAWELNSDGTLTEDFLTEVGVSATGLAAPTGVEATDTSSTAITVTWAAVSGASSYRLYRGTTSIAADMELLATDLTTTRYEDAVIDSNGPDLDQVYWYRVVAYSATSISTYSDPESGKAPTSEDSGDPVAALIEETVLPATKITVPSGKTSLELKMWGGGGNGGVKSGWVIPGQDGPGGGGGGGAYLHITGIPVSSGQEFYIAPGTTKKNVPPNTIVYRGSTLSSDYVRVAGGSAGEDADGKSSPDGGSGGAAPSSGNTTIGGTVVSGAGESAAGNRGVDGNFGGNGAGGAGLTRAGRAFGAGGAGTSEWALSDENYGRPGAVYYSFT